MTQGRIDALEKDKERLQAEARRLQDEVAGLRSEILKAATENARLDEALGNAESNNVFATILIGVGGFLASYATFTGKAAGKWAAGAACCLLAGIGLMSWHSIRRWRKHGEVDRTFNRD